MCFPQENGEKQDISKSGYLLLKGESQLNVLALPVIIISVYTISGDFQIPSKKV